MNIATATTLDTVVHHRDEGPATWFLNGLMTVKASNVDTGGAYCLMEHVLTPASNPPMHIQTDEEEAFYVIDGQIEFEVEGQVVVARAGTFALVPRGAAHTFRVLTDTARTLVISSTGANGPAPSGGLERFFRSVGTAAPSHTLPVPAAPDPVALTAAAAEHGIVILPPG
ncbi:MAG TPA: cupin domain-containing protein [Ilumatobacteraceae bacterium]|nr:cupin domain-containing protein [Ilumatobacteraceae bacterium]